MLGVAVQSKTDYVDYEELTSSAEVESRITAYIDVVRATEPIMERSGVTIEELRELAHMWIQGEESGALRELPPSSPEDTMYMGIRSQILRPAKDLAHKLTARGQTAAEEGRTGEALEDMLLSLRVVHPLRYSDASSLATVGLQQRKTLQLIEELLPKLDDEQRERLREELPRYRSDAERLERTIRSVKRVAVLEQIHAREVAEAKGEDLDEFAFDYTQSSAWTAMRVGTTNERELDALTGSMLSMLE
jgi:hypothetical protein